MGNNLMRFRRNQLRGMDCIEIAGPFDVNDTNIDGAILDIIDEGKKNVIFDLSKTSYVTSPGLAVLIKAIKRFQTVTGTIYVHGATRDVIEYLKLSRIDGFLRFM